MAKLHRPFVQHVGLVLRLTCVCAVKVCGMSCTAQVDNASTVLKENLRAHLNRDNRWAVLKMVVGEVPRRWSL